MKKLALVIPTLNGGGAEKNILFLCENLKKYFHITLIVFNLEGELKNNIPNGVDSVNFKKRGKYAFFKLFKYLRKEKFDIIFSTIAIANLYLSIIKIMYKSKKIIIRETNILSVENHGYIFNKLYQFFIRYVDIIIAQSNDMKEDLINNFNLKKEKIIIINNPVNLKDSRLYFSNKSEKIKLISVGRLVPQKGYLEFLQELSEIKNLDYQYEIYGEGYLKEKIEKEILEKNLEDKVFLKGFSQKINEKILDSDYLVLPSLHEGFPNVLLEALSLGKPILSNNCKGGINEIIKEGKNGYIFNLNKRGDFQKKMEKSLKNEWNYDEIKNDIDNRYSDESILKKYLEVLL